MNRGLGVRTQTIISVQNVVSFPIYTEKDEKVHNRISEGDTYLEPNKH
jgi:hypothetical protein